jgi:type I restriction enzyme M protein
MIDASKIFREGRRENYLSDENINKIVELYNSNGIIESDLLTIVGNKEIHDSECSLDPKKYLRQLNGSYHGATKTMGELILNITRGAQIRAAELDKLDSEVPTDCQYLMLSNINSGIVDKNLPYLKELPKGADKYLIRNNNLLLSKNGAPYKAALPEFERDKQVIANGNLFVIELDTGKVIPGYLLALFESTFGKGLLDSISAGSAIPNISLESLKNLKVPLPSLKEQKTIADKYLAKLDELKLLENKTEKVKAALKILVEEEL